MIWAAAWLYKATKDSAYLTKAERCTPAGSRPGCPGLLTGQINFQELNCCSMSSQEKQSTRLMFSSSVTQPLPSSARQGDKRSEPNGGRTDMQPISLSSVLGQPMLGSRLLSTQRMLVVK